MAVPMYKWIMRAAIIPAIVITYISVAGLTGFCPTCTGIVDSVLGRDTGPVPPIAPGVPKGSVASLTAYTVSGEPVLLAQYVGKPMILDVWATWCGPCRTQRSIIHNLDPAFLKTVSIVSLSTDNDPRLVEAFVKKNPSESTDLMATHELLSEFGDIRAIPTLIFVDSQGRVRDIATGVQSARDLRRRVQGMLQERASADAAPASPAAIKPAR